MAGELTGDKTGDWFFFLLGPTKLDMISLRAQIRLPLLVLYQSVLLMSQCLGYWRHLFFGSLSSWQAVQFITRPSHG